jgi:hypothetical protein
MVSLYVKTTRGERIPKSFFKIESAKVTIIVSKVYCDILII